MAESNRRTFLKQLGVAATVASATGTGVATANTESGETAESSFLNNTAVSARGDFDYPWQNISRRSATMAPHGMIATSQPLAVEEGARVLKEGGTAADAAVAAAAMLNLVEPQSTGIGGDMFALTHFDGEFNALNGSGGAPEAADIDTYRDWTDEKTDKGEPAMPTDGGLPVTVPGALDGWHRLVDRYGTMDLADLLQPAIEYARDGFPVTEYISTQWQRSEERLRQFENSAETFLIDGEAPKPGQRFTNPALADSFEQIAEEGISALYGGAIGEAVVETVQEHDGALALSDLRSHEGEWTDPISTKYRGIEVLEHPPNTQGAIALEALNIAENFDLSEDPIDPERMHRLIEAMKIAFADGEEYITDPAQVEIPLETMLSQEYATDRAKDIGSMAGTYGAEAGEHSSTIYLAVVDSDGNAVSFINSNYYHFGSALSAGGFSIQNRGALFSLDPEDANSLAPGRRSFHTLIPGMLRQDGEFRATFGVMGGSMQPQGHLQVVANLIDSGLNPQAALDMPRFRYREDKEITLETTHLPDATVDELCKRGHVISNDGVPTQSTGGGQIIYQDKNGTLIGGSDGRKDGQAIGY